MVYKKVPSEYGLYVAEDGSLYEILESNKVMTPNGINYLWDTFNNIDEAAAAYGLTRVPEPEEPEPEPPTDPFDDIFKQILSEEVNK